MLNTSFIAAMIASVATTTHINNAHSLDMTDDYDSYVFSQIMSQIATNQNYKQYKQGDEVFVLPQTRSKSQASVVLAHSCETSPSRNKMPLDDFWGFYNGNSIYTDNVFKTGEEMLYWRDMDEANSPISRDVEPYLEWKRAKDIFSTETHSLFGKNGVTVHDIV